MFYILNDLTDFDYLWYWGCLHQNLSIESDFVSQFVGALSPLIFSFALGLKLSGTHRLLICAEDVNLLGENTNPVTLLRSSNTSKTGLEIWYLSSPVCRTRPLTWRQPIDSSKMWQNSDTREQDHDVVIRKLPDSIFSVQWEPKSAY
jgi:hypothetical protein